MLRGRSPVFTFWNVATKRQYCMTKDIFERFGLNPQNSQKKSSFDRILPKSVTIVSNTDGALCSHDIENFIKVRVV